LKNKTFLRLIKENRKNLILTLLFCLIQVYFIYFFFGLTRTGDTGTLLGAVNFFKYGEPLVVHRILRPLGPLIVLIFNSIFNLESSLFLENIIFYLLSAVIIYFFTNLFFNKKTSLYSALLFASSYAVLKNGLALQTDMGTYFFYLLSLYLILYLFHKEYKPSDIILVGFLSGLGVLMKESAGMGIVFFVLYCFFDNRINLKRKMRYILLFSSFYLVPLIINQIYVYLTTGYTYLDWYLYNSATYSSKPHHTLYWLVRTFFSAFTLIIPFFFIGLYKEFIKKRIKRLKLYLFILISSSIPILVWPHFDPRLTFILFPLIIPLSSFGVVIFSKWISERLKLKSTSSLYVEILILVLFVICNNLLFIEFKLLGMSFLARLGY
jgi:4-amino-4-deoxy-L-arabinose transferase-like glycosyltransferase